MADHDGPYAAAIIFQGEAPSVPAREADEVYGPISLWRDGDQLTVDSGGSLRAHATPSRVVLGGSLDEGWLGAMSLRRIMHHVIAHVLSLSGRLVAHGAAVGRGGGAVLLLGSSGSGKSTSAYLASLGGWSLLSDDLVVVRRTASGVEAVGVHRAIAVPPDVAGDDAIDIEHDNRERRRPDIVLDGRTHRLAAVALVQHGAALGSVEGVTGLSVANAFIGATPAAGNVVVAAEALRTAGSIATLPCFRLSLADSASERRRGTAGLFEQIAKAAGIAT